LENQLNSLFTFGFQMLWKVPTPVSALIHAATMVAAGVYFIVRIFPILSGDALLVIAVIGALSAFIPATISVNSKRY